MSDDLRMKAGNVTDTLITATERAGEISADDVVVILYGRVPDSDEYRIRVVCSGDLTVATANWLLDKAKLQLMDE